MNETGSFRTVLRGYDPVRVDQRVEELTSELAGARERSADLARQVEVLKRRLSDRQAASAASLLDDASTRSYADLGARIGQLLTLAEEEATDLTARAEADAEALRKEADADARARRAETDRYSATVRGDAETEAARLAAQAQRQAEDLLDAAGRDAAARQEEAEALWEEHRARAAQAAADFELSLAARRDRVEADLSDRTSTAREELAGLERAAAAARARAQSETDAAADRAAAVLDDASARAAALLADAREKADRVRRESERELTAASARRDSINAQLANVRQLLGGLSGGAPVIGFEEPPRALAPAAVEPADEDIHDAELVDDELDGPAEGAGPPAGAGEQDQGTVVDLRGPHRAAGAPRR